MWGFLGSGVKDPTGDAHVMGLGLPRGSVGFKAQASVRV